MLEPIFEADIRLCTYCFRPNRRAHDAIAEIPHHGTQGYQWAVLEPMGLHLSEAKTQIVHMGEGFNFLCFCIVWKRKRVGGEFARREG